MAGKTCPRKRNLPACQHTLTEKQKEEKLQDQVNYNLTENNTNIIFNRTYFTIYQSYKTGQSTSYPNFFYNGSSRISQSERTTRTYKKQNQKFLPFRETQEEKETFKKLQKKINKNPYETRKELLDSKSDVKLTVEQLKSDKLNQHL